MIVVVLVTGHFYSFVSLISGAAAVLVGLVSARLLKWPKVGNRKRENWENLANMSKNSITKNEPLPARI